MVGLGGWGHSSAVFDSTFNSICLLQPWLRRCRIDPLNLTHFNIKKTCYTPGDTQALFVNPLIEP